MFTDAADAVMAFVKEHQAWGMPVVFVLAFGESFVFLSLIFPATALLVGIGGVIGAAGINGAGLWAAATAGAALGDWISYWLGLHYGHAITTMWPLSRTPGLVPRAMEFFERWGFLAVFLERFTGPLRASVPLVAGISRMPQLPFQIANISSAFIWAASLLWLGAIGGQWLQGWFGSA